MLLGFILEATAVALALGGLLLQPKRDATAPPSWRNLSRAGRLILALILIAGVAKISKTVLDDRSQREALEQQQALVAQQSQELRDLRETNAHLIKVMSVADGYNAQINGIVTFRSVVDKAHVETALRNLFLKYAHIELEAWNRLGIYRGRVDYGAHPEVRRYLNMANLASDSALEPLALKVPPTERSRSFYFEIRCPHLKILNDQKIQYARFDRDPPVRAGVRTFPDMWRDFQKLYGIDKLFVYKVTLEELEDVIVDQFL